MVEQIDMSAGSTGGGQSASGYDADDIQVLEGLVAVRKGRGCTSAAPVLQVYIIWYGEIVDNAVDEHLAKFCSKIDITLHKDGSITVQDNGRGIPTGIHKTGIPTPRSCLRFCTQAVSSVDQDIKIRWSARRRSFGHQRIVRVA